MHRVSPLIEPGTLGLVLPPRLPEGPQVGVGNTDGATHTPTGGTTEWVAEMCRHAEGLGAGGLWATDHLFWGVPTLECLTTLTLAVAATRRVTVGSCVLQLPLRSPAAVAKQASTLQWLSGGRFVLGVGVGSHQGEYAQAGSTFADRGRRLDVGIDALRRAWSSGAPGYRHEPSLPSPVWIGGSTRAALRRAAAVGDGWIPLFLDAVSMADAVAELRAGAAAHGRDPAAVTPGVVAVVSVGADADRAARRGTAWLADLYGLPAKAFGRHLVSGSPDRCAEALGSYLAAGAAHVAVMVAGDDAVDQFAALAGAFFGRHAPQLAGVGA